MTPTQTDPFAKIQAETSAHRRQHGCGAYTFNDGPALIQLAQKYQPKRVLELGTALGYSACCFAHGSPDAMVDTIEADGQHVKLASHNIEQYGLSDRIQIHHGTFEEVLPQLSDGYEMIFFDGFAPSMSILDHLRKLLAPDGVLICADLELLTDEEMDRLEDEFANSTHWQKHTYIEDGGTAVLRKQS